VPEEEYARLYERLASSDPEQIEAAMVSLRAIKGAEDLEIEAAQRRPAHCLLMTLTSSSAT